MTMSTVAVAECLEECAARLRSQTRAHKIEWSEVLAALCACDGRPSACACDWHHVAARDLLGMIAFATLRRGGGHPWRGEDHRRHFASCCESLADALRKGHLADRTRHSTDRSAPLPVAMEACADIDYTLEPDEMGF